MKFPTRITLTTKVGTALMVMLAILIPSNVQAQQPLRRAVQAITRFAQKTPAQASKMPLKGITGGHNVIGNQAASGATHSGQGFAKGMAMGAASRAINEHPSQHNDQAGKLDSIPAGRLLMIGIGYFVMIWWYQYSTSPRPQSDPPMSGGLSDVPQHSIDPSYPSVTSHSERIHSQSTPSNQRHR